MPNVLRAGAGDAEVNESVRLKESTAELRILEQAAVGPANRFELQAAPIRAAWILEGNPEARSKLLAVNTDGMASTYMWDCSSGRFNWFYQSDETVCLLEGSVFVKFPGGASLRLNAGDVHLFPAGTQAEWTVETYVRKVAVIHVPLSARLLLMKGLRRALLRLLRPERKDPAPGAGEFGSR